MHTCPEKNCRYKTNNAARLEEHKRSTRHGMDKRSRDFRGHLAHKRGKK